MRNRCHLKINGQSVESPRGETLIDAALGAWKIIPHDCRSGQCETCRVTVVSGTLTTRDRLGHTVLACQARVTGDAVIQFDELPLSEKRSGIISAISLFRPKLLRLSSEQKRR